MYTIFSIALKWSVLQECVNWLQNFSIGSHSSQHNDTQHNNFQNNDTQLNDIQYNNK